MKCKKANSVFSNQKYYQVNCVVYKEMIRTLIGTADCQLMERKNIKNKRRVRKKKKKKGMKERKKE